MTFVLMSLAAYRVWRLLAVDDLPLVAVPRNALLRRWSGTWKADFIECSWCSGSWISFATVGVVWAVRPLTLPVLQALAVAAVVGLIGSKLDA